MDRWVKFFAETMGFTQLVHFDDKKITTEYSALMSKVMQDGTEPPADHLAHMHTELGRVAGETLTVEHYVDDNMRNIPDHYHAHARPKGGFFGHGFRRP